MVDLLGQIIQSRTADFAGWGRDLWGEIWGVGPILNSYPRPFEFGLQLGGLKAARRLDSGRLGATRGKKIRYSARSLSEREPQSMQRAFTSLRAAISDRSPCRLTGGIGNSLAWWLAWSMTHDPDRRYVVVVEDDAKARRLQAEIEAFLPLLGYDQNTGEEDILCLPAVDASPYADVSADPRLVAQRLGTLGRVDENRFRVLLVGVSSLLRKTPSPKRLQGLRRVYRAGDIVDREELIAALVDAGYLRVERVQDPGTFAVRGAVVDVFAPAFAYPLRLEWWDDEIESLRLFDPATQRSLRKIDEITIDAVRESHAALGAELRSRILALADELEVPSSRVRQVLENLSLGRNFFGIQALIPCFYAEYLPLWAHVPPETVWVVHQPHQKMDAAADLWEQFELDYARKRQDKELICAPREFWVAPSTLRLRLEEAAIWWDKARAVDAEQDGAVARQHIEVALDENTSLRTALKASRHSHEGRLLEPLFQELHKKFPRDVEVAASAAPPWRVYIALSHASQRERLLHLLRAQGFEVQDGTQSQGQGSKTAPDGALGVGLQDRGDAQNKAGGICIIPGRWSDGVGAPLDRLWLLSESDVFGAAMPERRRPRASAPDQSLAELTTGDYVVHVFHGIGRYQGLTTLAMQDVQAEFILIEYAASDRLYLPVYRIHEIERYSAAEGKAPRLDKLGGLTFAAKTQKVKADAQMLAEELLQLYARREAQSGFAFAWSAEDMEAFEATFPFQETPDQQKAIDAVKGDLEAAHPMDRLVCGDVGFGKTEVALRAAFGVAMCGKQVALLAPTTILVQQHFHTFEERMASFPLRVAALHRFTKPKARKAILAELAAGEVDIVVGTHALLAAEVRFADLGLVVIDEEQRFGVRQKERFKKLKAKVDMLTLTATPIPRTLHMGLMGMREISMITTAPTQRLSVHTQLARDADALAQKALRYELARGGQAFVVVPRIEGILATARRIEALLPEARVAVAHGRLSGDDLERVMSEFVEHQHDILVTTSIIESGLDIPRANTMLILRADQFGVAQLYQLRGRVGRGRVRAHCYLLVNSLERLSDGARRRLEAVVRHAELGSGFHIATHDLEIRGAGDLLGKRQSGSIAKIGFQAYARTLKEAVSTLRGEEYQPEKDPELTLDIPAYLPAEYIEDVGQRIELYRRLSLAPDAQAVGEIMEEMQDRYGQGPPQAQYYGQWMAIRSRARDLGIDAVELRGGRLSLLFSPQSPVDPDALLKRIEASQAGKGAGGQGVWRLVKGMKLVVTLAEDPEISAPKRLKAAELLLMELGALVLKASKGPGRGPGPGAVLRRRPPRSR